MNTAGQPQIGDWYQHLDKGESFQVVSVDETSGTVQIQTFDGELDSIEAQDWDQIPLVVAPAPKDWTGPLDDLEPGDADPDDSPSDHAALADRNNGLV